MKVLAITIMIVAFFCFMIDFGKRFARKWNEEEHENDVRALY